MRRRASQRCGVSSVAFWNNEICHGYEKNCPIRRRSFSTWSWKSFCDPRTHQDIQPQPNQCLFISITKKTNSQVWTHPSAWNFLPMMHLTAVTDAAELLQVKRKGSNKAHIFSIHSIVTCQHVALLFWIKWNRCVLSCSCHVSGVRIHWWRRKKQNH